MSYKDSQSIEGNFNTPKYLFNYLDKFFKFEIDPCDSGNNWLGLTYRFTKDSPEFNGLEQEWMGNAFVNPPYGAENESKWISKAFREYNKYGKTIFLLLPAKSEGKWFATMMINADIIIFPRGRVQFLKNGKVMNGNNIGSVIFGLRSKDVDGIQRMEDFLNYNKDELDTDYDIIDPDRYILYPELTTLKKHFFHHKH